MVRSPRQQLIVYLEATKAPGRRSVKRTAESRSDFQEDLIDERESEWIQINLTEWGDFGDSGLALELIKRPGLDGFFHLVIPKKRSSIHRADSAVFLVIARFCDPKSELYISKHYYPPPGIAFF